MNHSESQPREEPAHLPLAAAEGRSIVLFDGVCNLCDRAVQFIVEHDRWQCFCFASLQSEIGQKLVAEYCPGLKTLSSFVLIEDGHAYVESSGALHVARRLGGLWPLCYGAIILPRFLRDAGYRFVAGRRYRWFGRKESCMLPSPALRRRFLG